MAGGSGDVDVDALEAYLADVFGREVTCIGVLSDKLNLILELSASEGEPTHVLRRPLKLRHTDLFNPLDAEYRLLERLDGTEIPTQTPVLFCEDTSVLGEQFFVTTYLDGEPIPLGTDLPERFRNPRAREEVARQLIDTLAEIHSLDTASFEDVCDRQSPREQVARATERLDEATSVTGRDLPRLRAIGRWLRDNAPSTSQTALVHGDYRPGNALFTGEERPELSGVIDWETAMLGDPLTELGYFLLRWRDESDPTPSLDELEARYPESEELDHLREVNENGLSPFTARPGSPTRRALVGRYENATGLSVENVSYYRTHAAFMLATVWSDLERHDVERGVESNHGPWIDYLTMVAEHVADGEFPR
ncbi:phosphotransferase family protein [Halogranum rubrum]|nr:phosphotransferase family protein [Halogranum salarium]